MTKNKTYWKGLPELKNDEAVIKNASNEFPVSAIRRRKQPLQKDFLKG